MRVISIPSKAMTPPMEGTMPEMVLRMVVLPAPLAPIRATISPWPTRQETSCRARMAP